MAARKSRTPETAPGETNADLAPVVGKNLRRLRTERGLSLERLAQGDRRAVSAQRRREEAGSAV